MDQCPVIHKVTDHSVGKCPVAHEKVTAVEWKSVHPGNEVVDLEIETDTISDTPSMKQYKQLKKVMSMITNFYKHGSELKLKNYESTREQLGKLELDETMVRSQLTALDSQPSFKNHPKQKEYLRDLEAELQAMMKQKTEFLEKEKEFSFLFEWSKTIVKVCQWLETTLEGYAATHVPDWQPPKGSKVSTTESLPLSIEQAQEYIKGLDEITYNLQESQDFFQASVDGRLQKYHEIEKEIITAQLQALHNFPEDNPRREYVEGELRKDLSYVSQNMEQTPESQKRRQKMLRNHAEFFKVLQYHKEKLRELGVYVEKERVFDSKFNHYHD